MITDLDETLKQLLIKEMPIENNEPELDLGGMARRFELAGGNIRNIALAAAFLAADNGKMVDMSHLIRAAQREYQKMGKVVTEREFEVQHAML